MLSSRLLIPRRVVWFVAAMTFSTAGSSNNTSHPNAFRREVDDHRMGSRQRGDHHIQKPLSDGLALL